MAANSPAEVTAPRPALRSGLWPGGGAAWVPSEAADSWKPQTEQRTEHLLLGGLGATALQAWATQPSPALTPSPRCTCLQGRRPWPGLALRPSCTEARSHWQLHSGHLCASTVSPRRRSQRQVWRADRRMSKTDLGSVRPLGLSMTCPSLLAGSSPQRGSQGPPPDEFPAFGEIGESLLKTNLALHLDEAPPPRSPCWVPPNPPGLVLLQARPLQVISSLRGPCSPGPRGWCIQVWDWLQDGAHCPGG